MATLKHKISRPRRTMLRSNLMVVAASLALFHGRADAADKLDTAHSTIRIHVGKAGLFSGAGHEHWVSAPIETGELDASDAAFVRRMTASGLPII